VSFENFLASPELLAALSAAPPASDKPAAAANTSTASVATPATAAPRALQLAGGTMASGGAQKNQARLRAAVVTIESSKGTGSGFYIDRQGYLLTNFHVVQGAKFVKIKLQNGDKMVAEVVKANEHDDVALLKSPPVEFEPLTVRSDALEVGEEVFAVGTPLGLLDSTMTRGVLSADRKIQGLHLLQSDAAVTFGSSGGPLLDGNGQVIGITRAVLAGIGGFNIFVPVQDALKVLDIDIGSR
jgi:S1-C subfamily serine protease